MNPVAVKEFRQAVQSRWVVAILMLFLLISLIDCRRLPDVLAHRRRPACDGGRNIFMSLLSVLLITCIGFVPAYAGIRLSLERNDANIDLFFVTTITPGAIIRGKYLAAMALTLLIFSACMPFMILTYLLRGIDLPTIFSILAVGFAVCAAANAMGIFAGSISGSWLIRGLACAGVLFCLFYMTGGTIAMAESSLMFGRGMVLGGSSVWTFLGSWLLTEGWGLASCTFCRWRLLSPKPSNRMLVPRLYIMGSWAVSGILVFLWSYAKHTLSPITGWTVLQWDFLFGFDDRGARRARRMERRVRRAIPRSRPLRLAAFLFYTGSAGGIAWCALLFMATMLAAHVGIRFMGKSTRIRRVR